MTCFVPGPQEVPSCGERPTPHQEDWASELPALGYRLRAKISELTEGEIAAQDQRKRIDIRAPQSGRVHQPAVHTIGHVITPGATMMLIMSWV